MFVPLHESKWHLADIRAGIERLAGENRSGWTGAALAERLREVSALRERLDAELIRLVGDFDAAGAAATEGAASTTSWLRANTTTPGGRARDLVRSGRLAHRHEATANALASGQLSAEHLIELSRAVGDRRLHLYPDHEKGLLDVAADLDLRHFTKVTRRWAKLADDVVSAGDFMRHHRSRYLNISPTFDGAFLIDGSLDADAGAAIAAAIDRLAAPQGANDSRSPGQRRADALTQLAAGGGNVDRNTPRVNVVVDVEALTGGQDALAAHADIDWAGPIGRKTLERIVCDPAINRVVMAGPSEVLDWGRSRRLVSAIQRDALVVRDGGCTAPGCEAPPPWCDAHHVQHWLDGGPTDLANLVLLCRRHHVLLHEGPGAQGHAHGSPGDHHKRQVPDAPAPRDAPSEAEP